MLGFVLRLIRFGLSRPCCQDAQRTTDGDERPCRGPAEHCCWDGERDRCDGGSSDGQVGQCCLVLCPQTFVGLVSAWRGVVCGLVGGMSERVRVRRLTHEEGQALQRIVRRGAGKSPGSHVRWRRAVVVHASAGGNLVPVIAQLAATSPDRVREMIHRFNESPMASSGPSVGGWPSPPDHD